MEVCYTEDYNCMGLINLDNAMPIRAGIFVLLSGRKEGQVLTSNERRPRKLALTVL